MIRYIIYIAMLVAAVDAVKRYRPDYEYNSKTDAFYKLHTDFVTYYIAKDQCATENATLMVGTPINVVQAHGMLKQYPDIGDLVWVGEGGKPDDSMEDEEIDMTLDYFMSRNRQDFEHTCEAITRYGEVKKIFCYHRCPFICKVDAKDAFYDKQCDVFARGYEYIESVGSCYKVSTSLVSWNQAYAECQAEGAHLLVLNSEQEREAVHNLTRVKKHSSLPWYYAGIRAEKKTDGSPLVFKTIFGKTLEEAGYAEWCPGEPNNWDVNEICGSITISDGKYNDIVCYLALAFICEKEVNVQKSNK